MADYRAIMQLALAGRSYSEISERVGCSRRDIARVKKMITSEGITAERAESMTDAELAVLFPDGRRKVSAEYDQPDFAATLKSMKANLHFALQQAWRRYVGSTCPGKKYGYSQFCALFSDRVQSLDLVATLHHEPGRAMLVDWAGDTLDLVDAVTGQVSRAYLFVAVLPYSGVVFARGFMSMKSEPWLAGHVGAFEYFGGVPGLVMTEYVARNIFGVRAIHLSRLEWCDGVGRFAGWCPVSAFAGRVPVMVCHGRGLLGLSGVAALA